MVMKKQEFWTMRIGKEDYNENVKRLFEDIAVHTSLHTSNDGEFYHITFDKKYWDCVKRFMRFMLIEPSSYAHIDENFIAKFKQMLNKC